VLQPSEQPPPRRAQLGARDRLWRNPAWGRCWRAAPDTPATVTTTTATTAAATVHTAAATVTAAVAAACGGEAL